MDILTICQYAAAVGAGIAAVNQWVIKPLKNAYLRQWTEQKEENERLRKDILALGEKITCVDKAVKICQDDGADILGDRLMQAHAFYMHQGWATDAEKERFVRLHQRYAARGHNHLTQTYEEDMLALPNKPPEGGMSHD